MRYLGETSYLGSTDQAHRWRSARIATRSLAPLRSQVSNRSAIYFTNAAREAGVRDRGSRRRVHPHLHRPSVRL